VNVINKNYFLKKLQLTLSFILIGLLGQRACFSKRRRLRLSFKCSKWASINFILQSLSGCFLWPTTTTHFFATRLFILFAGLVALTGLLFGINLAKVTAVGRDDANDETGEVKIFKGLLTCLAAVFS
jgi:hypothetical protein